MFSFYTCWWISSVFLVIFDSFTWNSKEISSLKINCSNFVYSLIFSATTQLEFLFYGRRATTRMLDSSRPISAYHPFRQCWLYQETIHSLEVFLSLDSYFWCHSNWKQNLFNTFLSKCIIIKGFHESQHVIRAECIFYLFCVVTILFLMHTDKSKFSLVP